MPTGGYDEGYSVCSCFWGNKPADMVLATIEILKSGRGCRAIDLGCGDGKNAAALAGAGFQVVALDKSEVAIANAMRNHEAANVNWLVCDLRQVAGPQEGYDVVVATGSFHCLGNEEEIGTAILSMQRMTRSLGINVLSSFNDGPQDLRGHDTGFTPTLLAHSWFLGFYHQADWEILYESNVTQPDVHPHNGIKHSHSVTRILARRRS